MAYLKPVKYKRLIGATPVASVDAVDKLHILTDEVRVLSTKPNYLGTDHYYEENEIPDDEASQAIIRSLKEPFYQ
jgi:predicted phosphoribosyltransferase